MTQSIANAKTGMQNFLTSQSMGQKVFYQPYYSVWNLSSLADATGLIKAQDVTFFQVPQGQVGQGFTRPLTAAETSLPSGATGTMPGGIEFIAQALGVDIFSTIPLAIKNHLAENSALFQKRLSHEWTCGATRYWPAGEFGIQSQSVAVDAAAAATTIEYGVNGRVPLTPLPDGGEIYFPAKQIIQFFIKITEDFFCTANGQAVAQDNPLVEDVKIAVVMMGWQFEAITT